MKSTAGLLNDRLLSIALNKHPRALIGQSTQHVGVYFHCQNKGSSFENFRSSKLDAETLTWIWSARPSCQNGLTRLFQRIKSFLKIPLVQFKVLAMKLKFSAAQRFVVNCTQLLVAACK